MPRKSAAEPEIKFSNLQKVFFPATKFTKGDLVKYYVDIAPALLPHFRDRPVTLIRMPNGVHGERFYEKNAPGHTPDWVQTTEVPRTEGGVINYIMINDAHTLAWCANNAAIELHPFLHRAENIQVPTHLAFDLDPGEGADLLTCIEVALMLRELLDGLKLQAFPKVTGSKGLQLYVPLNRGVTYDVVTPFAKTIAEFMHRQHPDLIVSEMPKAIRVDKVFIDWSQNHEKKTTVGAYSVRGKRDKPFVSMPVTWEELLRARRAGKIEPLFFSPADALKRYARLGDLFAPVLKLKQTVPATFADRLRAVRRPPVAAAPAALRRYAEKRNFSRTSEPAPALPTRSAQGSRRRFVIQKHAASHLHYDFRLEMDDVLKSWAVPKGLLTELGVKRSCFQTEDHPLEYFSFEGVIPVGEYGGGTVMVWDIGTYDLIGGNYWKGDLKLYLSGAKLKGEWHMFRIKSEESKPVWLIQKSGAAAKPISAQREDQSVLTRRTMVQIAAARDAVWQSNRAAAAVAETAATKGRTRADRARRAKRPRSPGAPAPRFVEPMTARLVDELPSGRGWLYEVKFDGYRAQAMKHGDDVRVLSRKAKDIGRDFPAVVDAVRAIRAETALIDGEIVALDREGRPSFQLLQQRTAGGGPVVFYAFDLLSLDGEDWRGQPLQKRKAKLEAILADSDVKFSASLPGSAAQVVAQVRRLGLEGVIGKRADSKYESGERSGAWVKIKFEREQEFVVGGYTRGRPLNSLVVGYHDRGKLICVGRVPGGLNPHNRKELHALLRPLESDVCPFANLPNATRKSVLGGGITAAEMKTIQWVVPRVVAQVGFAEWTTGGNLRHASYKGLREDKSPEDVVREG